MDHPQPWMAADCIVFDKHDRLLLIRRKKPPFEGQFALPGGFIEVGETTEQAALRELREETGIVGTTPRLVGVYSDPNRDPRRHVISIAYLILTDADRATAGDDAATADFIANWRGQQLAFDHNRILEDALRVKRAL